MADGTNPMICKCSHSFIPALTGIYTLAPGVPYGAGYTCPGCGTDGMILWASCTEEQRREAIDAELARLAESGAI